MKDEKNQMMTTNVWLKQVSEGGRMHSSKVGGWDRVARLHLGTPAEHLEGGDRCVSIASVYNVTYRKK